MVGVTGIVRRNVVSSSIGLIGDPGSIRIGRVGQRTGRGVEIGAADRSCPSDLGIASVGQRSRTDCRGCRRRLVDDDGNGTAVAAQVVGVTGIVCCDVVCSGIGLVGDARSVRIGRVGQRTRGGTEVGTADRSRTGDLGITGVGERTGTDRRGGRRSLVDDDGHGIAITRQMVGITGIVRRDVVRSGIGLIGDPRSIRIGRVGQRTDGGTEVGTADRYRASDLGIAGVGEWTGADRRRGRRGLVDDDGNRSAVARQMVGVTGVMRRDIVRSGIGLVGDPRSIRIGRVS